MRLTCDYERDISWFHMTSPEFPQYRPICHEHVLDINVTIQHLGFYFCSGFRSHNQRLISRTFLEIGKLHVELMKE